jgi:methyltransferase (TIGR00027 family)
MAPRVPLVPAELHTSDRPSSTAQWTTFGRTLELGRSEDERIVTDPYAPVFLSATSRALMAPLKAVGPLVRQAERLEVTGLAASGLCRHRFIDDHLLGALPDVEQVLVLGAGYDSRAYRFAAEIAGRPVYEVDLAPLSRRKAAIVRANAELFGHASIHRVEIDFRTESLGDRLTRSGFTAQAPTFVVWEGVSMYLSRDAVHGTLAAVSSLCGGGSVLAMDFWQHLRGRGGYDRLRRIGERAVRLIGEPIAFTIAADDVGGPLGAHDFDIIELAEGPEMTERYATAGRHCDAGMYVVAARRR